MDTKKCFVWLKNNKQVLLVSGILLVFFIGEYALGGRFLDFVWMANGILLVIFFGLLALVAGLSVLKSLFIFAGELSLLIFLSQSYCNASNHSTNSDSALRSLLVFGILYIAASFTIALFSLLKKEYVATKEGAGLKIGKIPVIIIYLVFVGLFMRQVYLVLKPIVTSLCVAF